MRFTYNNSASLSMITLTKIYAGGRQIKTIFFTIPLFTF